MSEPGIWEREFDQRQDEALVDDGWQDEPQPDVEETPISNDVVSLLNLGELKVRMQIRDHEVVIRTLKMDEELEIGRLVKPYNDTIEEGRALATAIVAAAVESIDGKPLMPGLGPEDESLDRRFKYVRAKLYWPVIKIIYEEGYIPLIESQILAIEEFRKK